jgi:glycine/D-amino acid oxidase-like deaminating enzyme
VTDVIIAGAGITGAALAYELTRARLSVLVLEREFVGSGATAAGMGHIVVMDDSPEQLALTAYSRQLLAQLAPQLDMRCERDVCGTLWIAETAAQLSEIEVKRTRYAAAGIACDVLDEQALAAAEPELRRGLAGALRVPDDAVVYPPGLARWLMDRAIESGARLLCGVEVTGIASGRVTTATDTYSCASIINATGAVASQLTSEAAIIPRKGHLAITDRYPGFVRHQLVELGYLASAHTMNSESVAFNVQPRATGQLLIGSSRELAGWDATVNRRVQGRMLERAVEFMPRLADVNVIRTWTGFRPATERKLPFISAVASEPGVWIAAGHEGLGITTALGTARLLADMLLGREPWTDPAPYAL